MEDLIDDKHTDLLQAIERSLREQYDLIPDLTDTLCAFGLENAKTAVKQHFGFARNERVTRLPTTGGIIDGVVALAAARVDKVNDLTLKEFLARLDRILRSVRRHSEFGTRGYYDFIRDYV